MKKLVFGRKLGRGYGARRALFRALIRALISYGAIKTTKAKAKAVQTEVEKMILKAKKGGINSRREVFSSLGNDRKTVDRLFKEVVPAFLTKVSGYTRIINLPTRQGDRAEMARLEWSIKISLSEKPNPKKGKIKGQKEAQPKNRGSLDKIKKIAKLSRVKP